MTPTDHSEDRIADLDGLKALAHPLRVQIIEALSTYGPHTASTLGERLGESSGATSYHLRQLEKHGYVREVEGRGTARERWWERTPGAIHMSSPDAMETEAGRQANRVIMREWLHHREAGVRSIIEGGFGRLEKKWGEATVLPSASVHVTAARRPVVRRMARALGLALLEWARADRQHRTHEQQALSIRAENDRQRALAFYRYGITS